MNVLNRGGKLSNGSRFLFVKEKSFKYSFLSHEPSNGEQETMYNYPKKCANFTVVSL